MNEYGIIFIDVIAKNTETSDNFIHLRTYYMDIRIQNKLLIIKSHFSTYLQETMMNIFLRCIYTLVSNCDNRHATTNNSHKQWYVSVVVYNNY